MGELFVPIRRSHIQIHLKKHGLCSTLGSATKILSFHSTAELEHAVGLGEVIEDEGIYLLNRTAVNTPTVGVVNDIRSNRYARKYTHEAEIVVSTKEVCFTQKAILHSRSEDGVCTYLHVGDILDGEVATRNALVLCTIEIEQQGVLRRGAPVLHIIGIRHIGGAATALERIIADDVADKPFGEVSIVVFPHEWYIATCDILLSRSSRSEEITQQGGSWLNLCEIVAATCEEKEQSKYTISKRFHISEFLSVKRCFRK